MVNQKSIDWLNSQSYYFFNPKHPQEFNKLADELPFLESHIYLFSSSFSKICILSKKALLFSAGIANKNLRAKPQDKWLIALPLFHVSGLSILARSFLSQSSYEILKCWSPEVFVKTIQDKGITLSSLVPSQVYDLIQKELTAPKSLRALLVGGDFLSPFLYKEARKRQWPLLPCYGATETGSHIACAPLSSLKKKSFPKIQLLEGIELLKSPVKNSKAFYRIKSKGLLSAYFDLKTKRFYDPKDKKKTFVLPDQILLKKKEVIVKKPRALKVLSEALDLNRLQNLLWELGQKQGLKAYLLLVPDKRRTHSLVLLSESNRWETLLNLKESFNKKVLPYERIQSLYVFSDHLKSKAFLKFKSRFFLKELGF